ncbi:MAG: 2-hydroxymuconic semialdehyde dehydrogenase [Bdellovibrio sp. ArHS]|uniref:aldehyde dehydrogenase family protein n=1 Tax=Bdellovibrio sp. ArHS TaxID=1569284 RepID=UPI00058350DD|nr:aldehyde dehydrogenase family protein [Bdellovibrio sp. ArHS]KHD89720.1 MAG: 2-hydroxymuconic semialdehyde dehydrogenase [Bdellovibrio sp. ArHS]
MELSNFIGGEFVPAESKSTFSKFNPFTGQLLASVSSSDAMDVVKALQVAKKAALGFKDTTTEQRADLLNSLAQALQNDADQIAYEEALHQGLPHSFVLKNSVEVAVRVLRDIAEDVRPAQDSQIRYQPSGIVGIITSWCCSLRLIVERMAPALAAGNVVVVKVSEQSPITAKILGECLQKSRIPAGVVNILQGSAEVAQVIAGHPSIRAVTAAGKTSTIEAIAKVALPQFKKLQLSGGAKNPSAVLAETDFKSLLPEILRPFLMGQGQMCWNVSQLFVLESLAPEFLTALKDYLTTLRPLKDPRGSETWTPLISEASVRNIDQKIQSGVGEHGKIFVGGPAEEAGYFYRPTVMLDLPHCSLLQQDELHGPLLLVTPVKYQHEIQKWANTSYLAHSAVIWGPTEKALKVASSLDAAHVWLNSWTPGEAPVVFGHKQSSFGNLDMSWNGSFYSDVKKLAGL